MDCRTPLITFALALSLFHSASAQNLVSPTDLYAHFDAEHDLAKKELLLGEITKDRLNAGPRLLALAKSSANQDTRWMAMRGMVTVGYQASFRFLEASLSDSDPLVRANAARALGDLRVTTSGRKIQSMFAAEKNPAAIEQSSLALRMLHVRTAVPYIRAKIPHYEWQTRAWLLQALGALGAPADVPLIASYLNSSDMASAMAATDALEDLTGVSFGPHLSGPSGYPTPNMEIAQKWWKAHKADWPHCDDCHFNQHPRTGISPCAEAAVKCRSVGT